MLCSIHLTEGTASRLWLENTYLVQDPLIVSHGAAAGHVAVWFDRVMRWRVKGLLPNSDAQMGN